MADRNAPIQRPRSHNGCRRMERLTLSLLLLLHLSSSIPPWCLTDGKKKRNTPCAPSQKKRGKSSFRFSLTGFTPPITARVLPGDKPVKEEGRAAVEESLIGSRPPSCDGRCKGRGRPCVAVQVPVTPQRFRIQRLTQSMSVNSLEYTRGEDMSNYKPMTWKCRCGDIYFNP